MTNEIKEILDKYKNMEINELSPKQCNKLLDYITNLQEENERLKEILKWKQNREGELFTIESVLETNKQLYDERNIYKSRIDKAIEYIKENEFYLDYKTGACIKGVMPLLNILQGEDN